MKKLFALILGLLLFVGLVWASDRITLQGERTIYTVRCDKAWEGAHCAGRLVAGERYAFRASVRRREVVFWTRGSSAPSGTYTDCSVVDRDNWTCNVKSDQKPGITYAMINGRPQPGGLDPAARFHDVAKWKWWLIDLGVPFTDAND